MLRNFVNSSPFQTQIRWYRKPRFNAMAPSKLFRIPKHEKLPESQREEMMRLSNIYRTQVKAVRHHMYENYIAAKRARSVTEAAHMEELREIEECFAVNDEWNRKVAQERDVYLKEKEAQRRQTILNQKRFIDENRARIIERSQREILEQAELAKSFITRDMLDEAIDKCLNETVSYDFAINSDGTMIRDDPQPPAEASKTQ